MRLSVCPGPWPILRHRFDTLMGQQQCVSVAVQADNGKPTTALSVSWWMLVCYHVRCCLTGSCFVVVQQVMAENYLSGSAEFCKKKANGQRCCISHHNIAFGATPIPLLPAALDAPTRVQITFGVAGQELPTDSLIRQRVPMGWLAFPAFPSAQLVLDISLLRSSTNSFFLSEKERL